MKFSKWHGLGNAYLLAQRSELDVPLTPERVRYLCAEEQTDGIVEIESMTEDEADVKIWNPDGSIAEVSGNGVRIAARWLATRTGVRQVVIRSGERVIRARMLKPPLVETDLGDAEVGDTETIEVDGEEIEFTPVSVGNPHAVVARAPERDTLLRLGPRIETHARFPNRTNVQLMRVDGTHDVTALVWERGAGETTASGSSAAAVAAASIAHGWCESPVTVHMPGGELEVRIEDDRVLLVGPAEPLV
jgi:diaminopimelate epimerase